MTQSHSHPPWREEKVFLVFVPHGAGLRALKDKPVGDWLVQPRLKPASHGQALIWKTVPGAKLELFLPDVFDPTHVVSETGEAKATVRDDAPNGLFLYEAYCNGQLATGGSPPGVIIDP